MLPLSVGDHRGLQKARHQPSSLFLLQGNTRTSIDVRHGPLRPRRDHPRTLEMRGLPARTGGWSSSAMASCLFREYIGSPLGGVSRSADTTNTDVSPIRTPATADRRARGQRRRRRGRFIPRYGIPSGPFSLARAQDRSSLPKKARGVGRDHFTTRPIQNKKTPPTKKHRHEQLLLPFDASDEHRPFSSELQGSTSSLSKQPPLPPSTGLPQYPDLSPPRPGVPSLALNDPCVTRGRYIR